MLYANLKEILLSENHLPLIIVKILEQFGQLSSLELFPSNVSPTRLKPSVFLFCFVLFFLYELVRLIRKKINARRNSSAGMLCLC